MVEVSYKSWGFHDTQKHSKTILPTEKFESLTAICVMSLLTMLALCFNFDESYHFLHSFLFHKHSFGTLQDTLFINTSQPDSF